jgi:hypothetical protein
MSDPKRTGDPDHMKDYLKTTKDSGGVHTNSNIHNNAAYNVLNRRGRQELAPNQRTCGGKAPGSLVGVGSCKRWKRGYRTARSAAQSVRGTAR